MSWLNVIRSMSLAELRKESCLRALADATNLDTLQHLDLCSIRAEASLLKQILSAPWVQRLRWIELRGVELNDALNAWHDTPPRSLHALDLSGAKLDHSSLIPIFSALPSLKALGLPAIPHEDAQHKLQAALRHARWPELHTLLIKGAESSDVMSRDTLHALLTTIHDAPLAHLDLAHSALGDERIAELLHAFAPLKTLRIYRWRRRHTAQELGPLLKMPACAQLEALHVSCASHTCGGPLGEDNERLRELILEDPTDELFANLADPRALPSVEHLMLMSVNGLSVHGALLLGQAGGLCSLRTLTIAALYLEDGALRALLDGPLIERVAEVRVEGGMSLRDLDLLIKRLDALDDLDETARTLLLPWWQADHEFAKPPRVKRLRIKSLDAPPLLNDSSSPPPHSYSPSSPAPCISRRSHLAPGLSDESGKA